VKQRLLSSARKTGRSICALTWTRDHFALFLSFFPREYRSIALI
jgi:hypothetical protein